ncbi:MAG: preprotein translocase subunit YajC [Stagnimonas sp.]|nr:preprotein translocase subunit YajC [Stagnimonas sp.]
MLLDFLISPAYAQQAATSPTGLLEAFWPLMVMIPLFYFLLIRPQMKRQKESRQMLDKLAKGDEVVTTGGIAGRIVGIGEVYLTVELADNLSVKVQKSAVATVLPKGTLKTL